MSHHVTEQSSVEVLERATGPGQRRPLARWAGILAVMIGSAGVTAFIAGGGLAKASAGEEMLDGARDSATLEGSARLRADADLLATGGFDVLAGELPTIGSALGLDESELRALIDQRYPAMAAGVGGAGDAAETLETIVANLERNAVDFERADALPIGAMSLPAATVATMFTTALLAVCGLAVLRGATRMGLIGLVGISTLALIWLLATQTPQKAAAAERVLDSLNLSGEATGAVADHFDTAVAFFTEYESVFIPDAASALGVDPDSLRAELGTLHPAAAQLRTPEAAAALENIGEDVNFRRDNIDNFRQVDGHPLAAVTWASVVVFAAVAAVSAAALATTGRDRSPEQH